MFLGTRWPWVDDQMKHEINLKITVYGRDAREAAEKFAERVDIDSCEYDCANGEILTVQVRKVGDEGEWTAWHVDGSYEPYYKASES